MNIGCQHCGAKPDYGDGWTFHKHGCPHHTEGPAGYQWCIECVQERNEKRKAAQHILWVLHVTQFWDRVAWEIIASARLRITRAMEEV